MMIIIIMMMIIITTPTTTIMMMMMMMMIDLTANRLSPSDSCYNACRVHEYEIKI